MATVFTDQAGVTPVVVADREALLRHISILARENARLAYDQQIWLQRGGNASSDHRAPTPADQHRPSHGGSAQGGDANRQTEAVGGSSFTVADYYSLNDEVMRLNGLLATCSLAMESMRRAAAQQAEAEKCLREDRDVLVGELQVAKEQIAILQSSVATAGHASASHEGWRHEALRLRGKEQELAAQVQALTEQLGQLHAHYDSIAAMEKQRSADAAQARDVELKEQLKRVALFAACHGGLVSRFAGIIGARESTLPSAGVTSRRADDDDETSAACRAAVDDLWPQIQRKFDDAFRDGYRAGLQSAVATSSSPAEVASMSLKGHAAPRARKAQHHNATSAAHAELAFTATDAIELPPRGEGVPSRQHERQRVALSSPLHDGPTTAAAEAVGRAVGTPSTIRSSDDDDG